MKPSYGPVWRMLAAIAIFFTVTLVWMARTSPAASYPAWWKRAALCVHSHEGSWRANTGNGYYGGMQMDWTFMRTHGRRLLARKGTADHWTPREQLRVAYRGWKAQGWGAWPAASRLCGLR